MNESKVKGLEWILVKHRGWVLHFKLVYINCFEKKNWNSFYITYYTEITNIKITHLKVS